MQPCRILPTKARANIASPNNRGYAMTDPDPCLCGDPECLRCFPRYNDDNEEDAPEGGDGLGAGDFG